MIMADFTEDMYEEDEFSESTSQNNGGEGDNPPANNGGDPGSSNEPDFTTEVLRLKGIKDPNKIKFTDETGAIVERAWDTLSRSEQLSIMADQDPEETQLEEDEIAFINEIRDSGMTIEDYKASLQKPANKPAEPTYRINELSDDEVFALDLLDKIGSENITDEEIEQALASAKQNETLFKKTVAGLRAEYIRLQQDEEARVANEQAAQNQAAYNRFAASINREIQGFDSFVGQPLELSREDQEELASFMLELDDQGVSAFGKALNNPKLFTKAAFWLLNEDKITEELTKQMQETYKRGYEQAKRDLKGTTSKFVFNPKAKKADPFADEEDW